MFKTLNRVQQLRAAADVLQRRVLNFIKKLPDYEQPFMEKFVRGRTPTINEIGNLERYAASLSPTITRALGQHAARAELGMPLASTCRILIQASRKGNAAARRHLLALAKTATKEELTRASERQVNAGEVMIALRHPQAYRLAPAMAIGLRAMYDENFTAQVLETRGFARMGDRAIEEIEKLQADDRLHSTLHPAQQEALKTALNFLRGQQRRE